MLITVKDKRGCRLNHFSSLSLYRFDFDFSLEESIQRRLDLSVKNSVSFMSRERELIGKVRVITRARDPLIRSINQIKLTLS